MNEPIDEKIHEVIKDNIGEVEHIILNYEVGTRPVTYADEAKQFGFTRIQAIKVMKALIKRGNIDYAVGFNSSFSALLQFCKEHPWHSVLHKLTEEIFAEVLRSNSGYPDDYKTVFLEETKLDEFIPSLEADNNFADSNRHCRNGVMASFIVLANLLENSQHEFIRGRVLENEQWTSFKHGELEHSNTLNDMPLAGHQTTRAPDDDDDSDDNHYETSMDKLFATFTQVKENYDSSRSSEMSDNNEEEEEGMFDDVAHDEEEKPLDEPKEEPDEEAEEVVTGKNQEEEEKPVGKEPVEEPKEEPRNEGLRTPEQPKKKKECPNSAPVREEEDMVEKDEYMDNTFWESPLKMSLNDILADNDYI